MNTCQRFHLIQWLMRKPVRCYNWLKGEFNLHSLLDKSICILYDEESFA